MATSVTSLARIQEAHRALSSAKTLDDVLKIRDQAEALRVYIKCASDSLDAANAAAEVKLRAERKAGEMLAAMEKRDGGDACRARSHDVTELPPSLDDLGIDKSQSSRWQREAAVDEDTFLEYLFACQAEGREVTQSGLLNIAKGCHVSANSGENEWYTPPEFIEAAREVMGGIDLDPASCETAQVNVKATRFFTADDDGLEKKWSGRVWLNPPYSKDLICQFAAKVVLESRNFDQAIVLVNNATETAWFHQISSVALGVCFLRGRVRFLDKSGKPANTPLQGQAVFYIGGNGRKFERVFRRYGLVCVFVNEK
jgi:phage N-6-adenine-methyltransferase